MKQKEEDIIIFIIVWGDGMQQIVDKGYAVNSKTSWEEGNRDAVHFQSLKV